MTAADIVLCGASYIFRWRIAKCWGKCGITDGVIVIHEGSPYYGPVSTCTNCGDQWSEGYLGERPFGDRFWRQKAIAKAQEMFARACQCPVRRDVRDFYPIPCGHGQAVPR
jgi:hypothetical protein